MLLCVYTSCRSTRSFSSDFQKKGLSLPEFIHNNLNDKPRKSHVIRKSNDCVDQWPPTLIILHLQLLIRAIQQITCSHL